MSVETMDPQTITTTETSLDLGFEISPYEDTNDANHRTHLVRPVDNGITGFKDKTTAQDIVDTARMLGTEVVALCGHTWVPRANPKKYDACEKCFELAGEIQSGRRF